MASVYSLILNGKLENYTTDPVLMLLLVCDAADNIYTRALVGALGGSNLRRFRNCGNESRKELSLRTYT